MPFTYENFNNPYVGSIADLMLQQGQIRANAATQQGAIWGRAAQGIGDAVSGVASAVAQQQDPRRKLETAQLQDFTDRQAANKKLDALMTPDNTPPGAMGPPKESYLDSQGLFDIPKLTQALATQGVGHLAPDLVKPAEAINDSIVKHQQLQAQADQAHTVMLGDMADGALKLTTKGVPIDAALDAVTAPGLATGRFSQDEYQSIKQRIVALPPEQQQAALGTLMDAAAKIAPTKNVAKDAVEVDRYGRTVVNNVQPTKRTATEAALDAYARSIGKTNAEDLTDADRQAYAAREEDLKRPPTSLQSENVIYQGKPVQVNFDPHTGKRTMTGPDGQPIDVTGKTTPIPSAAQVQITSGQLSDTAIDQAAQKYLDTGTLPAMGMGAAGAMMRTKIMNRAAELDPKAGLARNAAVYKADSANLTNLQKTEGTLSAFEATAGKNLDQFLTLAKNIPDTGVPWLNTPVRMLSKQVVGSANMAAIDAARDVALREIARVTNDPKLSGSLTDSARAEVSGLNPQNATLPQIIAVAKVLKQDMANVHSGLNQQIAAIKTSLGSAPGGAQTDPMGIR